MIVGMVPPSRSSPLSVLAYYCHHPLSPPWRIIPTSNQFPFDPILLALLLGDASLSVAAATLLVSSRPCRSLRHLHLHNSFQGWPLTHHTGKNFSGSNNSPGASAQTTEVLVFAGLLLGIIIANLAIHTFIVSSCRRACSLIARTRLSVHNQDRHIYPPVRSSTLAQDHSRLSAMSLKQVCQSLVESLHGIWNIR